MAADWEAVLLACLHDPPDKALDIKGHVGRACRYAGVVLGRPVSGEDLEKHADRVASAVERLPMPTAGNQGERAVGPVGGQLSVVHPLSGEGHVLPVPPLDPDRVEETLRTVLRGLDQLQDRYLALWRRWPEALAQVHPSYARLPADTRVADHTLWNHLDITTGLQPALAGAHSAAFLSLAIGPVQGFIAAARTVRDLWSGSMILSYLAFRGLLPVIEELGPGALVYPALRGVPLLDLWLRDRPGWDDRFDLPDLELRKVSCVPHRFLAVVPWGVEGADARRLAERCREAVKTAWREDLACAVRRCLGDFLRERVGSFEGWDARWDEQVDNFFDVRTALLPWKEAGDDTLARLLANAGRFEEAFPDAAAVRGLADAMPDGDCPRYMQKSNPERGNLFGVWQARLELSARLMEAGRSVRHVPPATGSGPVPPKCSLLGSYEQMGPAGLDDSRRFWEEVARAFGADSIGGVRLGRRERLCAVSLVKRFAGPAFFVRQLGLGDPRRLRLPDTATVAAAAWLARAGIDPDEVRDRSENPKKYWSSQWLHWSRRDQDPEEVRCPASVFREIEQARSRGRLGRPPAYYAILVMDGDHMAGWLRGERSPRVGQVIDEKVRADYFERLPDLRRCRRAWRRAGRSARRCTRPSARP
jgi:CRISPR-associated protein Cmr2